MKPKPPTEKQITNSIRQVLNVLNVFHWKQWQGPMSQPKGVSDILGIFNGKMLAIEVKKPGGKLTMDQEAFLDRVSREGGIAFKAECVEDVILRLGVKDRFLDLRL